MLHGLDIELITSKKAGIRGSPVEDGATLELNALKKAQYVWHATRGWVIADDSGIFIRALNWEPGVRTARWAGDGKSTAEISAHALREMQGRELRTAVFRCSAVVITPSGNELNFPGSVHGSVTLEPRGALRPNMPFDPIFQPTGYDRTWAEMTVEECNETSHRGRAFERVREFLRTHL